LLGANVGLEDFSLLLLPMLGFLFGHADKPIRRAGKNRFVSLKV